MIIDAHTHIRDPTWPAEYETPEYTIKVMDRYGIDMSVIIPLDGVGGFDYRIGNTETAKAVKKYPEKLIGVAHIIPTMYGLDEALKECDRVIKELGFKGLKTHTPTELWYANSREYGFPLVEKAIKLNVPIFFHCGDPATCEFSDPVLIADLAEHFPEATIVLGHMGHRRWGDAIWAAKKNENIYLDTSFTQTSAIVSAAKTIGADRVMFGSDNPINSPGGVLGHIRALDLYGIPQDEIDLILGKNAEKVYLAHAL